MFGWHHTWRIACVGVLVAVTVCVSPCRGAAARAAAGNAKIFEALREPASCEFIETPLADVIAFLKDRHHVEIQVDERAVDAVGIKTDVPVTRNLKGVTLHSALRLILDQLGLVPVVSHEVLLITSSAESQRLLRQGAVLPNDAQYSPGNKAVVEALRGTTQLEFIETPLADVMEFLKDKHGIGIEFDYRALEEIGIKPDVPVTRTVKDVTLNSALRLILGQLGLVPVVQHEVLLITSEKKGRRLVQGGAIAPSAEKPAKPPAASAKIDDALKKVVNLDFIDTPLTDVVAFLKDTSKVEIQIDIRALDTVGIKPDVPCTIHVKGVSLESGLGLVLRKVGLTLVVEDEFILITAPKEDQAEDRTWTDVQGRKIKAKFVRAAGKDVVLLKDGQEVTVPLARLSPADRAYVRSQAEK